MLPDEAYGVDRVMCVYLFCVYSCVCMCRLTERNQTSNMRSLQLDKVKRLVNMRKNRDGLPPTLSSGGERLRNMMICFFFSLSVTISASRAPRE